MPLLFLGFVVAYLDRANVGFAKLQMLGDLKLSETVYGLGAGIFYLSYALFEVPSNLVLHRVGARRWIARIMLSWGLVSAATMFVRDATSFYVLRFLLGAAEAGFLPGVIYYLGGWFPSARRAHVLALFLAALPLSLAVGGPLSGAILQWCDGWQGLAGWQWLFVIEALPSLVVGVAVWKYLPDRIDDARWLGADERARLRANLDAPATGHGAAWQRALLDPHVWYLSLIYFCPALGITAVAFWLPTLIKAAGVVRAFDIGVLSALPYVAAAGAMVLVARASDASRRRRAWACGTMLTAAAGLALAVVVADQRLAAFACVTLGTLAVAASLPAFWPIPSAFLGGAAAAAGIALINSAGALGAFLGVYLVGWLKDLSGSTAPAMLVIAAVLAAGAGMTWKLPARVVDR